MKPSLNFNKIEKYFLKKIEEKQENEIINNFKVLRNERKTGYLHQTDYIESKLIDCVECVKIDGTVFFNVEFEFETKYEIEILRKIEKDKSMFISMPNLLTGEEEIDYRYVYPLFVATFEISNTGNKRGDYKLLNITLYKF